MESINKNTEAINTENVKEEATMAQEIKDTQAIEATTAEQAPAEEKLPKFNDVLLPADEEREMLLITATRNKNTKLFWDIITVLAGADVKQTIAGVTDAKRVNLVDMRNVKKFLETGTPLRGMASTIADLAAKYGKVMQVEVQDKVALTKTLFAEVMEQTDSGVKTGVWCRQDVLDAEKAAEERAEETPAEAPAADTVEDPYEVAE